MNRSPENYIDRKMPIPKGHMLYDSLKLIWPENPQRQNEDWKILGEGEEEKLEAIT